MKLTNDPFNECLLINDLEHIYDLAVTDKESYIIYDALEEYYESILGTNKDQLKADINKLMNKILKFQVDNKL